MKHAAEILREYGPFPEVAHVDGVSFDGQRIWFASGDRLTALDPESGEIVGGFAMGADAGTAFDGTHLYQIAGAVICRIDPRSGEVLGSIPAPCGSVSGLAWAEGTLWVGAPRDRSIHQLDPGTGTILRTIRSDRFVTGVTWVDGELWHGTWESDASELRRVDATTGSVEETIAMPDGVNVSGLESDGADRFFCGGGHSGTIRAVRRPR